MLFKVKVKDNIVGSIEDIEASTASIPYISILFAKRHGRMEGRRDGGTDRQSEL